MAEVLVARPGETSTSGKCWVINLTANIPKKILNPNIHRASFTIYNPSASVVYLGYGRTGSTVKTTGDMQGLPIPANGGSITDDEFLGEVWAICGSSVSVNIIETSVV